MSDKDDDPFGLPLTGKDWDSLRLEVRVALLKQSAEDQKEFFREFRKNLREDYVGKDEFRPVMRLVYGMASLMLAAVATAIVNSILKGHAG
jgi:hypothetical protein